MWLCSTTILKHSIKCGAWHELIKHVPSLINVSFPVHQAGPGGWVSDKFLSPSGRLARKETTLWSHSFTLHPRFGLQSISGVTCFLPSVDWAHWSETSSVLQLSLQHLWAWVKGTEHGLATGSNSSRTSLLQRWLQGKRKNNKKKSNVFHRLRKRKSPGF